MPKRYPCPVCKGEGFLWESKPGPSPVSSIKQWRVSNCYKCDGHKWVFVDKDGWYVGPDAPPRYLCDHGEKLTDPCEKCRKPESNVPHVIKVKPL